jgi:hypothetical protein
MIANAATGAPIRLLACIVRGWLELMYGKAQWHAALDDPRLFPAPIRDSPALRAAILEAAL